MLNVRVSNTKLGVPFTGVVGIVTGDFYSIKQNRVLKNWDKLYPNWQDENVLFVKLDEPGDILRPDECDSLEDLQMLPYLPKCEYLAIPNSDATIL